MGRYTFKLPDVGEGTAEAEIVEWHVKVGDRVEEDQKLVDVMTDKATVEMTSPVSGIVVALSGKPGDVTAVGAPLAELEVEDADKRGSARAETAAGDGDAEAAKSSRAATAASDADAPRAPSSKRLASPSVRARADELGIKLQSVPGSGPAGRVSHSDLDAYVRTRGTAPSIAREHALRDGIKEIKIIGLRRKIAEKMQESQRRIPHFAYVDEIDVSDLEALRTHLNATKNTEQPRLTLLPFLMRALAKVLPSYPQINARFDDEAGIVRRYAAVHIGIATQTANGLIVPVVRHAEARNLWDCAAEVARLAKSARDGNASREDLSDSTITITSLGPFGGVVTTPVINYPEVAIIGPNAIIERPVVRNGQIVVRKIMNLSSSFDHRVVDGYDAARFVQNLKGLLEHPATLFID